MANSTNTNDFVLNYLNSSILKNQSDVIGFKEKVFSKLNTDPSSAILNFGKILEFSLSELELKFHNNKTHKNNKKIYSLWEYINSLEFNNVNKIIIEQLNELRVVRNNEVHYSPGKSNENSIKILAQDCALKILHFLVWKYECWMNNQPNKEPSSIKAFGNLFIDNPAISVSPNKFINVLISNSSKNLVDQNVDSWGISYAKSRIYALSEIVGAESLANADLASSIYPINAFSLMVPIYCTLKWKRAYNIAFNKIFNNLPSTKRKVGDFHCIDLTKPSQNYNGLLSAERLNDDSILVKIDNQGVLKIYNLNKESIERILQTINNYGRLGISTGLSVYQRLIDIPLHNQNVDQVEIAKYFNQNRYVLIPLMARIDFPGKNVLLPVDKKLPPIGFSLLDSTS
ncbi:MAG TPA: hypothetical protein PLP19_10390 [bacterium]|nr:hypothetical protein [bacterium]HPN43887.1 hypothetical protein [bacterium]